MLALEMLAERKPALLRTRVERDCAERVLRRLGRA